MSLNCLHDGRTAEGWTVRGTRPAGDCGPPGSGSGPSCVLSLSGPSAGRFWCEASSGQRSDNVSITVLGEDMSTCPPVHMSSVGQSEPGGTRLVPPGSEGPVEPLTSAPVQVKVSSWRSRPFLSEQDVMSRCAAGAVTVTSLRRSSSWVSAGWDPDRSWFSSRLTSYWCSTNQFGRSPLSFLRVTGQPVTSLPVSRAEQIKQLPSSLCRSSSSSHSSSSGIGSNPSYRFSSSFIVSSSSSDLCLGSSPALPPAGHLSVLRLQRPAAVQVLQQEVR